MSLQHPRGGRTAGKVFSRYPSDSENSKGENGGVEGAAEDGSGEEREESNSDEYNNPDAFSADAKHYLDTLREALNGRSNEAATSSFAERLIRLDGGTIPSNAPYFVIGRGSAGTVFEVPGTEFALKKGSVRESIWADSQMTNLAHTAITECKGELEHYFPDLSIPRVPRVQDWVSDEDMGEWWAQNGKRFVNVVEGIDDSKRGHVFCTQRILPLPQTIRVALVKLFFPRKTIESALSDPYNKNCLVRPYFGRRRSERDFDQPQLTLENYPLYLDQLLHINLDIKQYSEEMAVGLAVIHWRAQLDGMDMEFVIGSAASNSELPVVNPDWRSQKPLTSAAGDFTRRTIHLWMLDYDKASPIDYFKDWKVCCRQMVTAVTANDPYFPNPVKFGQEERQIWKIFEAAYLKAAKVIIAMNTRLDAQVRRTTNKLPKQFIKQWKKVAQEQADNEDGGFVEFG